MVDLSLYWIQQASSTTTENHWIILLSLFLKQHSSLYTDTMFSYTFKKNQNGNFTVEEEVRRCNLQLFPEQNTHCRSGSLPAVASQEALSLWGRHTSTAPPADTVWKWRILRPHRMGWKQPMPLWRPAAPPHRERDLRWRDDSSVSV